ncbi:hypothetical protein ACVIIW_006215 [Bradyrhizobium sp. USDA 4449]
MRKIGLILGLAILASVADAPAIASDAVSTSGYTPDRELSVLSTDGHVSVEVTGRDTPTSQERDGNTISIDMDRDNDVGTVDSRDMTIDRDDGSGADRDDAGGDHGE